MDVTKPSQDIQGCRIAQDVLNIWEENGLTSYNIRQTMEPFLKFHEIMQGYSAFFKCDPVVGPVIDPKD